MSNDNRPAFMWVPINLESLASLVALRMEEHAREHDEGRQCDTWFEEVETVVNQQVSQDHSLDALLAAYVLGELRELASRQLRASILPERLDDD